jgi:hypothetical protein
MKRATVGKPAYDGGSIVNLMASIAKASGGRTPYPELRLLPAKELRDAKRIVLVIIDGLGAEWLRSHGEKSFLARHAIGTMTSVFPSTTAAAMTSFSTGVAPQQHGLTGWFVNFREIGMTIAPLTGFARGYSLPLPPDGVRKLITGPSLFHRVKGGGIAITPVEYEGAAYNDVMTDGATRRGFTTMDDLFRQLRASARRNKRLVTAYWPDFDTHCHVHGIGHRKTLQHFTQLDKRLTAFAARLPKGTTLIVSADHGLVDAPHALRLEGHPRLLDCLSAPLSGDARLAYCSIHPGKEKTFITYVRRRLRHACTLKRSSDLVAEGWFGRGKEHPMLRHRIGDYTLLAKPGWTIRDTVLGEPHLSFLGHHSGTTKEEMLVPLIVIRK